MCWYKNYSNIARDKVDFALRFLHHADWHERAGNHVYVWFQKIKFDIEYEPALERLHVTIMEDHSWCPRSLVWSTIDKVIERA